MPTSYPVALGNFNWTPVTLGAALLAVLVGWFMPRYGAAKWYHGKSHTLADDTAVSVFPRVGIKIPSELIDCWSADWAHQVCSPRQRSLLALQSSQMS